jgi:hypothetical protein
MIETMVGIVASSYRAGDLKRMAAAASAMLATIPGDRVAMQFLALALNQMGRGEAARQLLCQAAEHPAPPIQFCIVDVGEPAFVTSYREATRPDAGLHEAWQRIAILLAGYGYATAAEHARTAAATARRQPAANV